MSELWPCEKGYGIMSRDLSGISLEDSDIEVCKRYCGSDQIVVERIPEVVGFDISISFSKRFYRIWSLSRLDSSFQILWFKVKFSKQWWRKPGRIVFDPRAEEVK